MPLIPIQGANPYAQPPMNPYQHLDFIPGPHISPTSPTQQTFPQGYEDWQRRGAENSARDWHAPGSSLRERANIARPALANRSGGHAAHNLAVPSGPPRKPKQSGHALWVGNLPLGVAIEDLKDHFARGATNEIESVSVLRASNCAFVNYSTEEACRGAHARFNHSRLHSVRLLCRIRGNPTRTTDTLAKEESAWSQNRSPASEDAVSELMNVIVDKTATLIVDGTGTVTTIEDGSPASPDKQAIEPQTDETEEEQQQSTRSGDRYFIVKSLTLQDLQASLSHGIWQAQLHNQAVFDTAYAEAENVYLIFSINKSGEYFGYARMSSPSSPKNTLSPVSPLSLTDAQASGTLITPTAASATAPAGIVVEELARGTLFWEVASAPGEEAGSDAQLVDAPPSDEARSFNVEWRSIRCVPFQRVRGLRNAWNGGKEVKIARDGTELEPTVGGRLLALFHSATNPTADAESGGTEGVV